jgi:hypothetical protein
MNDASRGSYKIGLVQMSMAADPAENLRKAEAKVAEAARMGAALVCLPELFRSRYFAQREDAALFDLAESVPGPSTEALGRAALQAGVVVIAPLFERRAPGLYHNTAVVIDADGHIAGLYRKMHIPDDPAYYEKFYFAPGDLGFRAFDTRVGPGVLGPVVPGGRAPHGAAGSAGAALSHRYRLAPARESDAWGRADRGVADRAARPRDRERGVRRRRQPRGPRTAGPER